VGDEVGQSVEALVDSDLGGLVLAVHHGAERGVVLRITEKKNKGSFRPLGSLTTGRSWAENAFYVISGMAGHNDIGPFRPRAHRRISTNRHNKGISTELGHPSIRT